MNFILDFDDFHYKSPENCLSTIYKLISKIPNIKLSLFTVPMLDGLPIFENKKWCTELMYLIESNNICLCPHGLTHSMLEFLNLDYDQTCDTILIMETIFKKSNLPIVPVFKGPNWGINKQVIKALQNFEYTHIYNHLDYKGLEQTSDKIKFIYYDWNLKDEFDPSLSNNKYIIAHGHTWNACNNGIEQISDKILEFDKIHKPTYLFVNEI